MKIAHFESKNLLNPVTYFGRLFSSAANETSLQNVLSIESPPIVNEPAWSKCSPWWC